MVTRHWGALLGIVSLIGVGSLAVACGGDDDDNGTTAGPGGSAGAAGTTGQGGTAGTGTGGSAGETVTSKCDTAESCKGEFGTPDGAGKPPAKPADAAVSSTDLIHGIDRLFIGDTDRAGVTSASAWKDYGFDIDGWSSTPEQGWHCQPQTGGKVKSIRTDGTNGIDNSFGSIIVNNVLSTVLPDGSQKVTDSISEGSFSVVLKMEKLGLAADTATGVKTQLYAAAGTKDAQGKAVAPTDWSAYQWHPYKQLLESDGVTSKVIFPDAYVTGNTWVSGGQGTVNLQLALAGQTLELAIQKAQIDVTLAADHKTGSNGNIGGILQTEQLITSLKGIAGSISASLCGDSPTFDGIAKQIRGASDIMVDGTQDASKTCDGISIGIGFTSKLTTLGDGVEADTSKNPCDGAAGAGGSN